MLTVFCPDGETSTWETHVTINNERQKVEYRPRPHNGRMVLDVPRGFYTGVILRSNRGMLWESENYEVTEWLGKNDHASEVNDAFPGIGRAPLVAPVVTEAAPVILKMRAPAGTSSYSVGGVESKIGQDGLIEVEASVAETLKSHGFLAA